MGFRNVQVNDQNYKALLKIKKMIGTKGEKTSFNKVIEFLLNKFEGSKYD